MTTGKWNVREINPAFDHFRYLFVIMYCCDSSSCFVWWVLFDWGWLTNGRSSMGETWILYGFDSFVFDFILWYDMTKYTASTPYTMMKICATRGIRTARIRDSIVLPPNIFIFILLFVEFTQSVTPFNCYVDATSWTLQKSNICIITRHLYTYFLH